MELIVAITENNVIGFMGDMPWHLPADLAHFKSITSGHAVLMGRKTWDAIGKPLPNRLNIVLSRQNVLLEGAIVVSSIEEALQKAGDQKLIVIGGGEIYRATMECISTMHVTRIHTSLEGDTHFPQIDTEVWALIQREKRPADDKNTFALTFELWQRKPSESES